MVPQGLTLATCSQLWLNPQPASHRLSVYVRRPDKMAASTTTPKGVNIIVKNNFASENGYYHCKKIYINEVVIWQSF